MNIVFKIIFLPIIVIWRILRSIAPELTRPLEGLANGLARIFRLQ